MLKLDQMLGSLGAIALFSACGQNPSTVNNPYAYSQPAYVNSIPVNPLMNGATGINPLVNSVNNPNVLASVNPFLLVNTTVKIPIYSNNQIVGYRSRTALLGGTSGRVQAGPFQQTVSVNAGDRLIVNLEKASYGAAQGICEGALMSLPKRGRKAYPLELTATYNRQNLLDGPFDVPTAGSVVVSAQVDPVELDCGGAFKHRDAEIRTYFVNLSSTGNAARIGSNTLEIERCTDLQGNAMACPAPDPTPANPGVT